MAHKNTESEGENLSRIKDILFGEDLQSIEQKLDIVKGENSSAFDQLKSELENRFKKIELLMKEKSKEVDKAQEKIISVQKNVNEGLKQEIEKINIEVNNGKINLENTTKDNIEQFTNTISKLETTINQTIDKLKNDHESRVNDLNKNKINKDTLADILVELAKKLKK